MDIPCEKCQTVYELDGKLIKSSGTLVRCSKCRAVFKVYPPDTADRRKFPRAKTRNLIAHITVDRDGAMLSQGLGKALDISKGGMLLETLFPVEKGMLSLMAVDKDHSLFEMKAELVYCKKTSSGMYHSGIKFTGNDSQVKESIIKLIKEYNHRKKDAIRCNPILRNKSPYIYSTYPSIKITLTRSVTLSNTLRMQGSSRQ